jgi:hypothetical protein
VTAVQLTFLRPLYARAGQFVSVYIDTSRTSEGARQAVQLRWQDDRKELAGAGADAATLDAVGAIATSGELSAPAAAVFGGAGAALLAVRLPAPPLQENARWSPLPQLLPLLLESPPRPPHLLVDATLAGGDVAAVRTDDDVTTQVVHGTGWPVHKVESGGWSQRRYQNSAREAWETNAKELADAVVQVAAGGPVEAVVVAGDPEARTLLVSKLPKDLAGKVVTMDRELDVNSDELAEAAGDALRQLETNEARARLNTFRNQAGTGRAVEGLAETVTALRDGQVAALFIGGRYTDGDSRAPELSWAASPAWLGPGLADIGLSEADLRDRGVTELAQDRVDAALIRAAVGTDAELFLVPDGEAPPGQPALRDDIGALLRYAVPEPEAS